MLFPNPARTQVHLQPLEPSDAVPEIRIVDVMGRQHYAGTWSGWPGRATVDVTLLPKGIYFVELLMEGHPNVVRQLVKY